MQKIYLYILVAILTLINIEEAKSSGKIYYLSMSSMAMQGEAPYITTQPTSKTICEGTSASFSVSVSGTSPFTYQWRKNGVGISGATSSVYTIPSVVTANAGNYDCVVTGTYGSALSTTASLTVNTPISIATQPASATKCQGQSVTISVTATGTITGYQWRKGGINISGATGASYTISSVTTADAGNYIVAVTGPCGTKTSNTAALTVNTPVSITTQPANATKCLGESVTFSVSATGTGISGYQWRKYGANISGATSSSYTINNVSASDANTYDVLVTGTCGTNRSNNATLTLYPLPETPVVSGGERVGEGTVTFTANTITGTSIEWYLPNNTLLTSGETLTVNSTTSGETYIAKRKNDNTGCYSNAVQCYTIIIPLQFSPSVSTNPAQSSSLDNVSGNNIILKASIGTLTIDPQCNTNWQVTEYPSSWLAGQKTSGQANEKAIFNTNLNVNPSSQRSGVIKLKSMTMEKAFDVNQNSYTISVKPAEGTYIEMNSLNQQGEYYVLPEIKGKINLTVTSNATWNVHTSYDNWLHLNTGTYSNNQTLALTYDDLKGSSSRTGDIDFTIGSYMYKFSVGQLLSITVPDPDYNYIYVKEPRVEMDNTSNPKSAYDIAENIVYIDGLGRNMQEIQIGASPAHKDMVVVHDYDDVGREPKSYLGFEYTNDGIATGVIQRHPGKFVKNAISEQENFYRDFFTDDYGTSLGEGDYAFSKKVFEPSPLNRVTEILSPGKEWQTETTNNNNTIHSTQMAYYPNPDPVNKYTVGINDITIENMFNHGITAGTYDVSSLWITETRGENCEEGSSKGMIKEYTDKSGKVALKEIYETETSILKTYYVYDDFGRLRCVIPPKALGDPNNKDICYYYAYDERGRMTEKKIPGTGSGSNYASGIVYMVYDLRDRLVATQDGNQRAKTIPEWTFTKYDAMNRPVMTGIFASDNNLASIQSAVNTYDSENELNEIRGSALDGYTNRTFPVNTLKSYGEASSTLTQNDLLTITYYDDYTYPGDYFFDYTAAPFLYGDADMTNCTGLVTCTKTKLIGNTTGLKQWLETSFYYDSRSRVIQTQSDNALGGNDAVSLKYFGITGQVVEKITKHTIDEVDYTTIDQTYEYDHAGRLLTEHLKIDDDFNDANALVSQQDYNKLGQLRTKHLHQKSNGTFVQDVDYYYNIRGWLESINDPGASGNDLFAMRLQYNKDETGLGISPQYNGNISGMEWNSIYRGTQGYTFTYDALNRLKESNYKEYNVSNSTWTDNNLFEEKSISYDKNGNITDILRTNDVGSHLNYFHYNYTGNQIGSLLNKDNNTTCQNYIYDNNGNTTYDGLRQFTIGYNSLNLPQNISKGADQISYTYTASGVKVAKKLKDNSWQYYLGNFVYNNDKSLNYVLFEDGMIRKLSGDYVYEYFIKDHLGNTRIMFAADPQYTRVTEYYPFGMNYSTSNRDARYLYNGKEIQDDVLAGVALD